MAEWKTIADIDARTQYGNRFNGLETGQLGYEMTLRHLIVPVAKDILGKRVHVTAQVLEETCCDKWMGNVLIVGDERMENYVNWQERKCVYCPDCGKKLTKE